MDKDVIAKKFAQARNSYNQNAIAQKIIIAELCRHMVQIPAPNAILEIGCGTGLLSREILKVFSPKVYDINDICEDMKYALPSYPNIHFINGDAETYSFAQKKYNLIISSSTIQWFQQPFRFIEKMQESLLPDGNLLISTFGENNLQELQQIGIKGLNYPSYAEWKAYLSERFKEIHIRQDTITLTFDSALDVIKHFKSTGVNSLKISHSERTKLSDIIYKYQKYFNREGRVTLTYHPIYIIAKNN